MSLDYKKNEGKNAYNRLPSLPSKHDLETRTILLKTISEPRALSQFNEALINLPNPRLFLARRLSVFKKTTLF